MKQTSKPTTPADLQTHTYFQNVAEAIRDIISIDVTIMDNRRIRIAGTGLYANYIHKSIEKNTAFDRCLQYRKPQEILHVGQNSPICRACPRNYECIEKAVICVPITIDGRAIGVIGIIAFTDKQKAYFQANRDGYSKFLLEFASLLGAKYGKTQIKRESDILSQRLDNIIHIVPEPLVVYDERGSILHKNCAMDRLLGEVSVKGEACLLKRLWDRTGVEGGHCAPLDAGEVREMTIDYRDKKYYTALRTAATGGSAPREMVALIHHQGSNPKTVEPGTSGTALITFGDILGFSREFGELKEYAKKAAATDSNILITGETGTGKELFAQAMHSGSRRRMYPFVPINCAAIPENLLESELFGHEKGAFTGAETRRIGKIEAAENGTLFLDEISEMPPGMQVKLLRVIQEREICRIGSNVIRKVNVRFISATNSDLGTHIREGTFRKDLFFRLDVVPLNLPPLKKRRNEIVELAEHFMHFYAQHFGKKVSEISRAARELLAAYHWPGNIRELQNVMEYAVAFEEGRMIRAELVKKRLGVGTQFEHEAAGQGGETLESFLQKCERSFIERKLSDRKEAGCSKKAAVTSICHELGISAATFYRKIKMLNIEY